MSLDPQVIHSGWFRELRIRAQESPSSVRFLAVDKRPKPQLPSRPVGAEAEEPRQLY